MKLNKMLKSTVALSCLSYCASSFGSTSLTVGGHAGVVGQYLHGMPPLSQSYLGFQVPVGLIFQANPVDPLSVILELDYAYVNYPVPPILLGQTEDTTQNNNDGNAIPIPFASTINWGGGVIPFGQKVDTVTLVQAYFSYDTPFGLLRAGRMPRDWGLGIWYDANWKAQGSGISTTDAISFTTDFGFYDVSAYFEKYGQSLNGLFNAGSANGYSVEARIKSDPTDLASTGFGRNIGVLYTKFIHQQSGTDLNILDAYAKFYFPRFFLGAEVLFPSGKTKNPNFQTLGGAPACTAPSIDNQSCASQDLSSLGALLKMKVRFDKPTEHSTLYAVEKSQKLLGTRERQTSHVGELTGGYASGSSRQFNTPDQNMPGTAIRAIRLNPNLLPALMMFTNTLPLINGMPTASITNTTFIRLAYTYESHVFGTFTPAVIWGMINATNKNYSSTNPVCTGPQTINFTSTINNYCVGNTRNLGAEFDITYSYTTQHMITAQLDAGYWLIGEAWKRQGDNGLPRNTFGVRAILSTQF